MNRFFIYTTGAGHCRSLAITAAMLGMMLIMVLVMLVAPSHARMLSGNGDPVMKRAIDAGMDADQIERLISRAQGRNMTPEELHQILMSAISLAEMDLPYNMVMQKAAEGLAKQVSAPGILTVLDNMQSSMVHSADIVDPWIGRPEVQGLIEAKKGVRTTVEAARLYRGMLLESVSYSLQNNADDSLLREFLDEVASIKNMEKGDLASIAAGLQALSEMPMTRDNPGLNARLLIGAMNAGFTASEIRELPHAMRSASFHSRLPMEKIAGSLELQLHENIPAVQIMDNLFQGIIGGGPPGFHVPDMHPARESGRGTDRRPPVQSLLP